MLPIGRLRIRLLLNLNKAVRLVIGVVESMDREVVASLLG